MCSCVMQIKFILFCIVLLFLINGSYELDRSKRFLLFPRTGRTRIQVFYKIFKFSFYHSPQKLLFLVNYRYWYTS